MDTRDWIAAQITKNAITSASAESVARSDQTFATRLVDAAGALRAGRGQAFGLEIPREGIVGAPDLVETCLRAAAAWGPALDAASHEDLGLQLVRLGLPPIFAAPPPRERIGTLEIVLAAEVEDLDGETLADDALAALDDVETPDGATLLDVHPVAEVASGWAIETGVRLVHHTDAPRLRCELAFEVAEQPSDDAVVALVRVIERELLDTSWALNLEWELPDDGPGVVVHLVPKVLSRRFESADGSR